MIRRTTSDPERRTSDSFVEHIHRISFSAIVESVHSFVVRSRALGTFAVILTFSDVLSNVRLFLHIGNVKPARDVRFISGMFLLGSAAPLVHAHADV